MTKEQFKLGKEIRKNVHLTLKQKQLCYGSLLGDSWLHVQYSGQCGLGMSHCEKQKEYLEYKKKIMEPFFISDHPSVRIRKEEWRGKLYSNSYTYQSILHQDFTDMYGLFYRGNKKKRQKYISRRVLNNIDAYGLLIWFLDDGCLDRRTDQKNGSPRYILATNCFSLSEIKAIQKWFWQRWIIGCSIQKVKGVERFVLRFNVSDTKKLLKLFEPYIQEISECMRYKVIEISTTN